MNLPRSRVYETDNGFEDREGHQAPFTLREKEYAEPAFAGLRRGRRPTSNFQRRSKGKDKRSQLLFDFFNRLDDGVKVRPVTGVEFGMEEFAIGANLKSAPARWDERERLDALAEFKNFGRQTDGLRRVVSNHAIFDRHFGFHPTSSFPKMKLSARSLPVKKCNGGCPFANPPACETPQKHKLSKFAGSAAVFYARRAPRRAPLQFMHLRFRVEAGASAPVRNKRLVMPSVRSCRISDRLRLKTRS